MLGLPQRETSFKEKHLFQSRSSFANETHLNYFRTVRRRPWWCWGPSERGPMSASPALGSCQVMPVMLDLKGHNKSKEVAVLLGTCNKQCDYGMRLLLPRSGNLCLLPMCLPIQHTPPSISTPPTPVCRAHPAARTPLPQLPGSGTRLWQWGDAPSSPNSFNWTIKMRIRNLVPLQVPSSCCLRHVHISARRCNRDRHSQGGHGHESIEGYPDCQHALAAHSKVCASAAWDFAAHPGVPAVWVVQHCSSELFPAAVWRYSSQEPNACRWLQQLSQGRLTAV